MTAVLAPPAQPKKSAAPKAKARAKAEAPAFDADAFAVELDAIRAQILDSLGPDDAAYIRRLIRTQRRLDLAGRACLVAGLFPPAWLAGVTLLSVAKILENMEIGHNVMHAQWDWLQDPAIHSTTWEWDNVCPSSQWKHTHNQIHHQWTNVKGRDGDIGYGILRIDPDQPWYPAALAQPVYFVLLALLFEYGVGFHDVPIGGDTKLADSWPVIAETLNKIRTQATKDYIGFPLASLPVGGVAGVAASAAGAATANVIRNLWSFAVIFCGHFPDGTELFSEAEVDGETRGEWYRRQILGSANFTGGPLMNLMSGNLDHQIEHHLFPDLPSSRYAEIAPAVRDACERHGIAYNTANFATQFGTVIRKVIKLSMPGRGTR